MKSRFRLVAMIALASFAVTGCTTPHYRTHPDFLGKTGKIKTIALLEPDIKVCEVSAGGVKEQKEEWCKLGIENVTQAIINRFSGTPVTVKVLKQDVRDTEEVKEVLALYDAASLSIILHTYSEHSQFPDKVTRFDYSLGSLETLLQKSGADALLVVHGEDEIATAGKVAMNALGLLTGAAAGVFTGVVIVPRMEGTYLRAALAAKNGDILWFNFLAGSADLRDLDSADRFVAATFTGFPELGR